jgi:quercetin dioxygenase-like cupin family protein
MPESPAQGLTFDLEAVTQELRGEPSYAREGQTARTLIRSSDLRVVLVALRAGKTISEHHANATASVHVLTGNVRMRVAEHGSELHAGQLFALARGLAHELHAHTDSTFLLTLGWPGRP